MDTNPLLLSLKAWPEETPENNSLSNLISRIQVQRGHFRDINEGILEAEIAAQNGSFSNDMSVREQQEEQRVEAEGEGEGVQDRAVEAKKAKAEMAARVGHALNEALFGLDYVSLLVSLTQPEAGASSMSPYLKSSVPVGSLGFDKVQRKLDPKALQDDATVARVWKMEGLNSAVDTLLGASRKMEEEVKRETRYWEQILAIRDEGWVVTRMPRERQTLGVRYGFAESAPEYKNKGIGALRRGDDGSVIMEDVETAGSHGKAMLRVRVVKNGEVTGVSVQNGNKGTGSIKDMIQRARNFVYEDELFFEITREARTLANHGIRTSEDSVTIELGEGMCVVIDMAPLDDDEVMMEISNPGNNLAQGLVMALRILLSHNHRANLKKRSKPPPPLSQRKQQSPPLFLIRPIALHLLHQQHLHILTRFVKSLTALTRSTGSHADYNVKPMVNTLNSTIKDVESAVESFLGELDSELYITLPGGWKVSIAVRTMLSSPLFGTQYTMNTTHDGATARLMGENRFASAEEVELYLFWCLERSIVNEIRCMGDKWEQLALGNEMQKIGEDKKTRRIRVEVNRSGLTITKGQTTGGTDNRVVWTGGDNERNLMEFLRNL
ncbi:RNA polymerase II mediator complex subunit [Rhizina undulata]